MLLEIWAVVYTVRLLKQAGKRNAESFKVRVSLRVFGVTRGTFSLYGDHTTARVALLVLSRRQRTRYSS